VKVDTPMKDVLFEMTRKRLGLTTVVDGDGRLVGMISDGDLRRQMERHGYTLLDRHAGECMTRDPVVIGRRELATAALDVMEARKITSLLIVDERGAVDGVLHLHDLWKTEMIWRTRPWRRAAGGCASSPPTWTACSPTARSCCSPTAARPRPSTSATAWPWSWPTARGCRPRSSRDDPPTR